MKKIIFVVIIQLIMTIGVNANELEHYTNKYQNNPRQLQYNIVEPQSNIEELQLNAEGASLIDGSNNRLLYGKNENTKMANASTTKIMTCIVALENCKLDEIVTVSTYAAGMPKVHMNIKANEKYVLKDLLYAMMLESYNDVAVAIAEHVAASKEEFADMMNLKAKEIGALNTHFVTANGLDADNHYSTAYDMALIGAYAIKNEIFCDIIKTKQYSFYDCEQKRCFSVSNKDAFLDMDSFAIGIKTGYTNKAGYCFVGAIKKKGKIFVSCVLGSGWPPNKSYKWMDTMKLMKYGDENYSFQSLNKFITKQYKFNIQNGTKRTIKGKISFNKTLLLHSNDTISYKIIDKHQLPIKKGECIGRVDVLINNSKIYSFNLISTENVYKFNFAYCFGKTFKYFMCH